MVIDWWEVTQTVVLVLGSILWYYLRTGGTVTVSLEFNKSQNGHRQLRHSQRRQCED